MRSRWWVVAVLVTMVGAPAGADNPRVTLSVRNATVSEAAAALSQATQIPLRVFSDQDQFDGPARPPAPPAQPKGPRASFEWKDTPFSTALRELCKKYTLHPGRGMGGGYMLHPLFQAPEVPAPGKPVGLVEKGAVSMSVAATRVGINRMLRFDGQGEEMDDSHLAVEIVGRVKDGDAEAIAGLRNITALDDLGNRLVANVDGMDRNVFSPAYPDEWSGHLMFAGPHPRARKLVWLRGDVLHYRVQKTSRFQIDLPAPGKTVTRQAGDVAVRIIEFDPAPKRAADLPAEIDEPPVPGAVLKLEIALPGDGGVPMPEDPGQMAPLLIDENGTVYDPMTFSGNGGPGGIYHIECTYAKSPVKLVKAAFCIVQRSVPEKLFSFEMRDIPLPPEKPFLPHRLPTPPRPEPGGPESGPDHPFYSRGGGTLVQKVLLKDTPAREGVLAIGLSPQQGKVWGAVRWVNLDVEPNGLVRLPSLKPGVYRVRRVYRPAEGADPPAGGKWEGAEVEVRIVAGKEFTAPALKWTPAGSKPTAGTPPKGRGAAPRKE